MRLPIRMLISRTIIINTNIQSTKQLLTVSKNFNKYFNVSIAVSLTFPIPNPSDFRKISSAYCVVFLDVSEDDACA